MMAIFTLLLAGQLAVAIAALVFERGEDARFAGEKLGYRS